MTWMPALARHGARAGLRYFCGHRLVLGLDVCVDCGTTREQVVDGGGMLGYQCAQERVLRGRSATEARQLGDHELRLLKIDGVLYREHKIYRGALCVGTRYHVAEVAD